MSNLILTEEELNACENTLGMNYWTMQESLDKVINSHRSLNSRNLKLVLENDELMAENVKLKEENQSLRIEREKFRRLAYKRSEELK